VDNGQADVWVGHRNMHNVDLPRDIPKRWLDRVRTVPGVRRAEPYLIGFSDMALPSGGFEGVVVVGVDPGSLLGNAWNQTDGRLDAIRHADGIVVDDCEGKKLEHPQVGDVREIGARRARVVGTSHGITGFMVAPYVFTSYERAAGFMGKSPDVASYFLVQIDPDADAEEVCAAIRRRVPELDAMPRDAFSWVSIDFWMTRTGLGISFGAATLLGLLVGLVMVAQTLYAMVLDRLGEFGTLKAIGARESQILTILLVQATAMAGVGSALGLTLVTGIQRVFSTPHAPIVIPLWLSILSCGLVLLICWVSSWLPYHRIRKVDPMMVLQA
jgi:putative ABC transport system permease protein